MSGEKENRWKYSLFTDRGSIRLENQDAVFGQIQKETGIFLLCDGMGGHLQGGEASNFVVQSYNDWWTKLEPDLDFMELMERAKKILEQINIQLYQKKKEIGNICGSTLDLLLLQTDIWGILHVGDSRIYQITNQAFNLLTTDQTWGNAQFRQGILTEKEIEKSPYRDKLIQAVGGSQNIHPFLRMGYTPSADYFLCSDGVYKVIDEDEIQEILLKKGENNIEKIEQRILDRGAPDNFSMILIESV